MDAVRTMYMYICVYYNYIGTVFVCTPYLHMCIYSAQYEERELVTISVFSHFLGH